ncbi:MAG: phosphoribosylglycinamide formyltransferase [Bacteroidetes bacterium]|nr:phosphoribosylglycinamide formyltransferase [Bacteroidota bacterium]
MEILASSLQNFSLTNLNSKSEPLSVKNIAIFASGSGSNAENIANYFAKNEQIALKCIFTNNPLAGVIERAKRLDIPYHVFDKTSLQQRTDIIDKLQTDKIDLIVLAGFLRKIPDTIIQLYPHKIINIHPALLPKYGGKGMYGDKVHASVKQNRDKITGISIHYVNSYYDEGQIIFQKSCTIDPETESVDEIAQKVHALEYEYFPIVIEKLLLSNKS